MKLANLGEILEQVVSQTRDKLSRSSRSEHTAIVLEANRIIVVRPLVVQECFSNSALLTGFP